MSANLRMKPKQTDGSIIQVLNPKGEVVQEISSGSGEGGGGVSDGDKGDIVVSGSGATWTIEAAVLQARCLKLGLGA